MPNNKHVFSIIYTILIIHLAFYCSQTSNIYYILQFQPQSTETRCLRSLRSLAWDHKTSNFIFIFKMSQKF